MTIQISLSPSTEQKLRSSANASGQPLEVYATRLLEYAAQSLAAEEALAPFRKQVLESGMTDEDLDTLFDQLREKAFQERQRDRS